jgi:putative tryptophan/tyrosine transport system substrate-binding protein
MNARRDNPSRGDAQPMRRADCQAAALRLPLASRSRDSLGVKLAVTREGRERLCNSMNKRLCQFVVPRWTIAVMARLAILNLSTAASAVEPAHRISVLLVGFSPEDRGPRALKEALLDAGYTEGRDLQITWRTALGNFDRIPQLAQELRDSKPELVVADGTLAARAVQKAMPATPIVLAISADPVGSGLVQTLNRPGGNITGLSLMMADLSPKHLQLLKDSIPTLRRIAVLWNPSTPFHLTAVQGLKEAANGLSLQATFIKVSTAQQLESAFSQLRRSRAQALIVIGDPFFTFHRMAIIKFASQARLPVMATHQRQFAEDGALLSYGPNFSDMFRRTAGYVDKILKGAKAGDLPIEQASKFDLVVNLRAASALGLVVPESILVGADEVIR